MTIVACFRAKVKNIRSRVRVVIPCWPEPALVFTTGLKHGNATNEAEHAGTFHSMSRHSVHLRFQRVGAHLMICHQPPQVIHMPRLRKGLTSRSARIDETLAPPSIDNVALVGSSGNGAGSPDGSSEGHIGRIWQSSQLQFKSRMR